MHEQKRKALIAGCGLAGPAVALFLKRAGFEAEIYEARTTTEGYLLALASNGVDVLKTLALDGPVFAEGSPVSHSIIWNGRGKRLGEVPLAGAGEKSVFIKRALLGAILSEEAERAGVTVAWGKKLHSMEVPNQRRVVVTFEDGTTASGDLLIGCDGVHSRTRQLIDPAAPGAAYTGLMNSGGVAQGLSLPPTSEAIHFIFGRRAFFGYHVRSSGEVYWFVNYPQAQAPARGAMAETTDEERKRRLIDLFRDEQPFIGDIIQATESTFPDFPSYAIPTQPRWHRGPMVLAGDAVHAISPSSGQGASLALEDAAILAKCLRDIPQTEQALATYEQLRRARTAKMFDLGRRQDSGKLATHPVQVWLRDLMTPFFLKRFANPKALDWIYSFKVDWEVPVAASVCDAEASRETVNHVGAAR